MTLETVCSSTDVHPQERHGILFSTLAGELTLVWSTAIRSETVFSALNEPIDTRDSGQTEAMKKLR